MRGFTLVELLVVIAIIGILASIVVTSVSSSQERGSRTNTLATLRSVNPVILTCSAAGGNVVHSGGTPVATNPICYGATVTTPYAGFTNDRWPTLGNGWAYSATAGVSNNRPTTYGATKTGQSAVTCTVGEGRCN